MRAQRRIDPLVDDVVEPSLLRGSVRGGLAIVFARGGSDAVRLAAMIVLARLLTPAEFGVVAIVLVVVGVADVIQDLGLTAAAVQRPTLTDEQSSTLFWVNVTVGLTGSVLIFFGADLVAAIADDQRVAGVTRLLAPMFLISAFGTQHVALLRRALRFGTVARIRIAAAAVYAAVAIGLALAGVGQNSLVWGLLASTAVSSGTAWIVSPLRPGRPHIDSSTFEMARFGANVAAFAVLNYLAINLQTLAIGRVDGAAATGQFGRAKRLAGASSGYLIEPVGGVAFPVMSKLVDEPDRWERYYRQAQAVVVMATLAIVPILILHADLLVQTLLGDRWAPSAPVLAILGLGILSRGVCNPTGWIYQSRGDVNRMLRYGIFGWSVVLVGTMAGVPFGIQGAAWGYSIAVTVLVWPCLWYAFRGTALTVGSVLRSLLPASAAATAGAACSVVAAAAVDGAPSAVGLLVASATHLVVYLGLLLSMPGQRRLVMTIRDQVRP